MVDVDWYVEDDQPKYRLLVDKEKAALNGISEDDIARTMQVASAGYPAGLLHVDSEKEDVPLMVRLDRASRSDLERIQNLKVAGPHRAHWWRSANWCRSRRAVEDKSIYHKNLMPVTYVTGDVAGAMESPVYAILKLGPEIDKFKAPGGLRHRAAHGGAAHRLRPLLDEVGRRMAHHLRSVPRPGHRLRRGADPDLRAGGGLVPVVRHAARSSWRRFRSRWSGILPAHGLMGAFFTATSMIGFIAGAGIVVRNSIILVDFVELRLQEGHAAGRRR